MDIGEKDYVDNQLCHLRKELITRIDSNKEFFNERLRTFENQTKEAKEDMSQRLSGMNEFRSQLKDQAATFITRNEHQIIIDRLDRIEKTLATTEGKASQTMFFITLGLSILALSFAIIKLWL